MPSVLESNHVFYCRLYFFISYIQTVSIPEPIICFGFTFGRGKRHAIILEVELASSTSFRSKSFI